LRKPTCTGRMIKKCSLAVIGKVSAPASRIQVKVKYTALRKENIQVRELNQDMASEMASLVMENQRLKAIVENANIVGFPQKNSKTVT